MCGGKGERIKDFCSDKSMLNLNNEPLIEHILVSLKDSKNLIEYMQLEVAIVNLP